MTDYYIDPSFGTGGDGTEATPWDTWSDVQGTQTSGDTVYIQGGQTLTETITPASGVTVKAYGAGRYIIDGESTRDYCFSFSDKDNVIIEDFHAIDAVLNGIRSEYTVTSGTTERRITIRNGAIVGTDQLAASPAQPDVTDGTGLLITTDGTSDTGFSGYIGARVHVEIENVHVSDCGKHGFDMRGDITGNIRSCSATNNGTSGATATYGAHGFTFHPWTLLLQSAAWVGPTSNVYSLARVNANDDYSHMIDVTGNYALVRNTATPTTPGLGEWGYTSNTIYVRLKADADPGGQNQRLARKNSGPINLYDCVSKTTKVDAGGGEGKGFGWDGMSYRVNLYRCVADSNEGDGFGATLASTCKAIGCVAKNGSIAGFRSIATALGIVKQGCTAIGNTGQGFYEVASVNYTLDGCLGANNTGGNLLATAAATAVSKAGNWSYNGGSADTNITAIGTADPLIDANGKPKRGSPLIAAGTKWWTGEPPTCEDGRRYFDPPTVGAFEHYGGGAVPSRVKPAGVDAAKARVA